MNEVQRSTGQQLADSLAPFIGAAITGGKGRILAAIAIDIDRAINTAMSLSPEKRMIDHLFKGKNMDWDLLRQQKLDLVYTESGQRLTSKQSDSITGICNLIDEIQDKAVDILGISEIEVFGSDVTDED